MAFQSVYDIAELCHRKGIDQVVLCPGSRCAPLTLAFARHGKFTVRTFSDERSAAFIALGIARQTGRPCILICTSGTAVYNFAPAVAEAFFNHTPLLILTADRPAEWIGQLDGQTVYQEEIFGRHVKRSFRLPQQYDHADDQWTVNRTVNEAVNLAGEAPFGPVHVNIPLREPLYPAADEKITYSEHVRVIEEPWPPADRRAEIPGQEDLLRAWPQYYNILVVAGQCTYSAGLLHSLDAFSKQHAVPVAGDIISNLHGHEPLIRHADAFLGQASADVKKSLRPDLLITFGQSVLSKNLKLFLRSHTPRAHWHIQAEGPVADTFQHLTRVVRAAPAHFLSFMAAHRPPQSFEAQKQRNFFKLWEIEERRMLRCLAEFFPQKDFGEFEVVYEVLKALPPGASLHLANSMSVRYANFAGLTGKQADIAVYSNRGTSGIDGCTSTTVGHCLADDGMHVLITGDEAFFYDRNAFWHNHALPNLRVVLLNNHGGAIFKMIDGPRRLAECDPYFVTEQRLNAAALCAEFGFEHIKLDSRRKVKNFIKDLFDPLADGPARILEIETTAGASEKIFEQFKEHIRKSYEL